MYILGVSAFFHDSAATLVNDGVIIAAAQEERFSRIKNDDGFPLQAIKYCLEHACINPVDLTCVVFYDKPFLKFERLLETYIAYAPRGLRSFVKAMPLWLKQKLFLKKIIREELQSLSGDKLRNLKILFSEHHLSHAASAYYPSPFCEAAVLTIDGVGERATSSISRAAGNKITVLKEMYFPHSIGLLYSSFTYFLGFEVNAGEYKLMGLAPYGNSESEETARFIERIRQSVCTIHSDGSVFLSPEYFSYSTDLKMIPEKKWELLFGMKRRKPSDQITQQHVNLALAIQVVTEKAVINMAREARKITGSENLCFAGGVALNCVINGMIHEQRIFSNIFIQPAAGDAGGSAGAALAVFHIYYNRDKLKYTQDDGMQGALLGPSYTNEQIIKICRRMDIVYTIESDESILSKTATLLMEGKITGWFQGRMEFGPRALGNRSILADPRDPNMQHKLNQTIKFRESFRPFAPAVLLEAAGDLFEMDSPSPYMLLVKKIKKEFRKELPDQFTLLTPEEKLAFPVSSLPATTHVDFSSRIQTVDPFVHPRFASLLKTFQQLSGYPVLVNTSFNVKDEPIVCTPEQAIACFMQTDMQVLVLENVLILKQAQAAKFSKFDT
jgi:carbamoyltransferase